MRLLGDNGAGYELAQKLEENSVWQVWLGDRDYAAIQPYLATPGTWSAFMQSENPSSLIVLQLRVRALLFDKAVASLYLGAAACAPPSALDNSYLQLHADSVYYSLEQDSQDWMRLQAEKSPAMASLELKYGLITTDGSTRLNDGDGGSGGSSSRFTKSSQSGHNASSALISPKQHLNWTQSKMGSNHIGSAIDYRTLGELWYTQYLQRNLTNRMNRLAHRISQQRLAFCDQEACLRTSAGMTDYIISQANHRKRHLVLQTYGDLKSSSQGPSSLFSSGLGTQNPEISERDGFGMKPNQPGHERYIQGGEEGAPLLPELQYFGNCVPDNPVSARQSSLVDGSNAQRDFLDRLNHLQDLSAFLSTRAKDRIGSTSEASSHPWRGTQKQAGRKIEISEEAARQLAQQAVVRLVGAAGFEGLKQAPLQILVDLLACHMRKLGSGLRLIVNAYQKNCSQAELLNMYIHGASGSNLSELMAYSKTLQQPQKRRPAPIQTSQPTIQQALAQQLISPHPVSMPLKIPHQQNQDQHQLGQEKLAKRRALTPGGLNMGDRLERVASDAKLGGELGSELSTLPTGLSQMLYEPSSQGYMSWNSQAPNFAGLSEIHQPPILQHFKQQLSSLQIPPRQDQSMYGKRYGALKWPPPRVQGYADLSMSEGVQHEIEGHGEGAQISPGRQKRKQHQRSWMLNE